MKSQQIIMDSRVAHVRELKTEVARLRAENASLRAENEELSHHLDLAMLAAEDLRGLSPDGKLVIADGWNLVLGAENEARTPAELIEQAKRHLGDCPQDFVWIVFDGPRENSRIDGRLRVSYTGGTGPHRADKFICDFLRMARFRGDISKIVVKTHDKDFAKEVDRLSRSATI
jgi:hypothetical protein